MSIVELLDQIGPENVMVQKIGDSLTNVQLRKNGHTEVSFLTREINPSQVLAETEKIGLVVWIPRDKWMFFEQGGQKWECPTIIP